jgi:hypothetical protein
MWDLIFLQLYIITLFCYVTPFSLVHKHQRFGETSSRHFSGQKDVGFYPENRGSKFFLNVHSSLQNWTASRHVTSRLVRPYNYEYNLSRSLEAWCNIPYYFELKTPSNFRCAPLLKGDFQKTNFCKQIHFTLPKFTTPLARPLVLQGKCCFRDFRRVKNNISHLRRTLIFGLEKCEKKGAS